MGLVHDHVHALTDRALARAERSRPVVYGPPRGVPRSPLLAFTVTGTDPRAASALDRRGRGAGRLPLPASPTHHLGLERPGTCRLSFAAYTSERDVDRAMTALADVAQRPGPLSRPRGRPGRPRRRSAPPPRYRAPAAVRGGTHQAQARAAGCGSRRRAGRSSASSAPPCRDRVAGQRDGCADGHRDGRARRGPVVVLGHQPLGAHSTGEGDRRRRRSGRAGLEVLDLHRPRDGGLGKMPTTSPRSRNSCATASIAVGAVHLDVAAGLHDRRQAGGRRALAWP